MVEREIRFAEPNPAASNAIDLMHVHYYPYVDVFLTDKRMAAYINRVRARSTDPRLSARPPALRIADDIGSIERALWPENEAA
jgi:hypothetical protein